MPKSPERPEPVDQPQNEKEAPPDALYLPAEAASRLIRQRLDKFMSGPRALALSLCGASAAEIRAVLKPIRDTGAQEEEPADLHSTQTQERSSVLPLPTPTPANAPNQFRKIGDYWTATFEGKTILLKHTKGCNCIAFLLENPNREFLALHLYMHMNGSMPEPDKNYSSMSNPQIAEEGLSVASFTDAEPVMDQEYEKDMRRRLEKAKEDLDTAGKRGDRKAIAKAEQNVMMYTEILRSSTANNGHRRTFSSDIEKCRTAVRHAINRVLASTENDHPSLHEHLSASIHTGIKCHYSPSDNTRWML